MYEFYPEWGPSSHDPDHPRSHEAVQRALDLRDDRSDHWGERPDDN